MLLALAIVLLVVAALLLGLAAWRGRDWPDPQSGRTWSPQWRRLLP
jgi:hypothetical protein